MYTATSFVRVSMPDSDIMPKALITKRGISSLLKPKLHIPAGGINKKSNVGCSKNLSTLKAPDTIPVSQYQSQTDIYTETDNHRLYKQTFQVRSYEASADMTISVDTVLNYLQEAAVNYVRSIGFVDGSGVGRTPEMSKQNLGWVVAKMRVVFDQYPTWNDLVQVVAWISASGRNGICCNSIIRDSKTGAILIRASSIWVMMNMNTRRLCKIPEEERAVELEPYFYDLSPFVHEDSEKAVSKLDNDTADDIFKGLTPKWTDIDFNLHVNNAKYISWILESIPDSLALTHKISSLTLEYTRECAHNDVLQSLVAVSTVNTNNINGAVYETDEAQSRHLIRLEDGAEILRARIEWRPRK
uniref:Acyl-[acyl-carrier-protein] hydrolase n=1 Tax=Kalanchoe fedtschenkoi TaxID=63787 RepID=A0A7N0U684_KALFE